MTTASLCILITDILCTAARHAQSESFYKGRRRAFLTSHAKIWQRIFAERKFRIHLGRTLEENTMLKTEFFRDWGDWSCINHPVPNCNFTNELHPQLMEGTSLHQAAGQFRSLTWNMLIAVNLGTCCSCSTLFLLNCFSLDYLLDLSIPAPFPRSPVKGPYGTRSLNFDQRDRTRYNCRTPFILPSQQLNLTDFLPYFAICFFFYELAQFCLSLQKQDLF